MLLIVLSSAYTHWRDAPSLGPRLGAKYQSNGQVSAVPRNQTQTFVSLLPIIKGTAEKIALGFESDAVKAIYRLLIGKISCLYLFLGPFPIQ